jgi:hypothetical protein
VQQLLSIWYGLPFALTGESSIAMAISKGLTCTVLSVVVVVTDGYIA